MLVFGIYWLYRLTQCLGMFDPLLIIPLMQTAFMILGAIAAGIYFQEFKHLELHPAGAEVAWIMYILGISLSVGGLFLIAPPSDKSGPPYNDGPPPPSNLMTASPKGGSPMGSRAGEKGLPPMSTKQTIEDAAVCSVSMDAIEDVSGSPTPSPGC